FPDGTWAAEVRDRFLHVEPLYFADVKGTLVGLEAYLKALPQGPHAREATMRLRDQQAPAHAEKTDLTVIAQTAQESAAREAERREAVRDRIEQWIGLLLDPIAFARPMVEAKPALIIAWSLALPWPLCARTDSGPDAPKGGPAGAARRCTKLL